MNIFESVYHAIRNIFTAPFKPMKKKRAIRKAREKEHQKMIEETMVNASALKKKETRELLQQDLGQEVDRSDLITFKYVVKNRAGQTIKSSFDAKSKSEVEAFLHNEGYTIVSIEPLKKNILNMEINMGSKLKAGELSFALTQLSTYIKAGIPLIDSVRILAKQTEQPNKRKIYERIVFDLVAGESFSKALENQRDIFPRLLINMVKTAEMTGDLPSTLDEMSDYYTSID